MAYREDLGAFTVEGPVQGTLASVPVERSELARGEATSAPVHVSDAAGIEHGLRHLA